jgi:uncharacterized protein (DUF1015 family)
MIQSDNMSAFTIGKRICRKSLKGDTVEIKAFKAWRFDKKVVGKVGDCIAPPYDVISEKQQKQLYKKNKFNIVRIDRGKVNPADTESDNVYTRAADYLNKWIKAGVLKQDNAENIYAYVQDFEAAGAKWQRSGFVALGKLEEFGTGVRPHEKTLEGPKADRLKLTRETAAQFGQIFMLYDDPKKVADKIIKRAALKKPAINFVDDDGVRHRLYPVADTKDINAIVRTMSNKGTVIADGHHRYETALNYCRETGNPAAKYQMMTFVNMRNKGLIILPTHRLVGNLKGFDIARVLKKLEGDFEITPYPFSTNKDKNGAKEKMFARMRSEFKKGRTAFGLYTKDKSFYTVTLTNPKAMDKAAGQMSRAWRSLDVSVLHKLILEKILGIGEKQLASESNIEYIKDVGNAIDESIASVDGEKNQVVFFMNPTRIEQVQQVAAAGEKMPQKSTFFYPKIFTGLTINKL